MRTAILVLSLAVSIPGTSLAEMRIYSLDPANPEPGWVLDITGHGFGDRPYGRVVQLYRIVDRQPIFYPTEILQWRDDFVSVGIPRSTPPRDDYAIRIHLPGRMIASNSMRLSIRQPAPLARRADEDADPRLGPMPVAENRCGPRRGRSRVDGDTERWAGGQYACDRPPVVIARQTGSATTGSLIEMTGDFGGRRRDQVVALMKASGGRLYVQHLVRIYDWTAHRIAWVVTRNIDPGEYEVGVLYRLDTARGLPVFERGSNVVPVYIR